MRKNRKTNFARIIITVPALTLLVACAGNRQFYRTVRVDDAPNTSARNPSANSIAETANQNTSDPADRFTQAQNSRPANTTNANTNPNYATNWNDSFTTNRNVAATTPNTGMSSPRARLYGDSPAAGLNSDINNPTNSPTPSSRTPQTKKDSRLGLFGEIDGVAGLPGQFAALESIEQVSFAGEGADFNPSIDITGEFLLYASTQHGQTADIYQKSIAGKTVTRLTSDPADDIFPTFSPDNQHISFSSNRAGNWDIYIMDAQGGRPVRLTDDPQHELHASWSPDGRYIVYSRLSDASGRWEMWITEFANPVKKQFIGYGLFPSWCPDPAQNKIVYQQARERGSRLFSIWTIDIENGEGRRPTEIASAANAAAVNPAWSADGKMIAFATIIDPENQDPDNPEFADIWVIALDGNDRANLTSGVYTNLEPCWGPEGRIYFISNRNGIDNVWAIWPDDVIKTARGGVRGNLGRKTVLAEVPTMNP